MPDSLSSLNQFVEKNPYAICLCDAEGRYLESNPRHKAMFRFDEIPPEAVRAYSLFRDPLLERHGLLPELERVRAGGTVRLPEIWYNPRDLAPHWPDCPVCISSVCFPLMDAGGRVERIVVMYEDVTSLKRSQEEVERIRRIESLAQLAGGIAHDMNNYLLAVVGHLDLARRRLEKGTDPAANLEAIQAGATRLTSLAARLLTFAKKGVPIRDAVPLDEVLRETADFWLRGNAVETRFEFDDPLWPIPGDVGEIGQVFQNLVINACQAMADRGRLRISARNLLRGAAAGPLPEIGETFVRVEVEDSGPGIPEGVRDRIFTPFFSTKKEGSGLGLATVQAVVTRHLGRIDCPPNPGGGARFVITLPALPGAAVRPAATDAADPRGGGRLLLVDDDPSTLDTTRAMLEYIGYAVRAVPTAGEAARALEASVAAGEPIGLALIDLTLRGEAGGPDLLKALRAIRPGLPAILMSGFVSHPALRAFRASGFQAAIEKPFSIRQLGDCVAEALAET